MDEKEPFNSETPADACVAALQQTSKTASHLMSWFIPVFPFFRYGVEYMKSTLSDQLLCRGYDVGK